jgi:hypothetical protein
MRPGDQSGERSDLGRHREQQSVHRRSLELRAAWMQYVPVPSPTSSSFIDGNTPYPGIAAGGNIAGLAGYLYWNQLVYVEVGGYRTANGITGFMSAGVPKTRRQNCKAPIRTGAWP